MRRIRSLFKRQESEPVDEETQLAENIKNKLRGYVPKDEKVDFMAKRLSLGELSVKQVDEKEFVQMLKGGEVSPLKTVES